MLSMSGDNAIMKGVQATHVPDGREVDVKPILHNVEDILKLVNTAPTIDGEKGQKVSTLAETTVELPQTERMLETLPFIIHKISSELACKCSGGGGRDAHATTMVLFNTLSSYSWHAKVVLALAAFAVNFGELWLIAQLCAPHPLAKSVALLKPLPDIIENSHSLRPQFEALSKLIKASIEVTKCIVQFKELPSQYISENTPPMSIASASIPIAAYWTIRSIVACASLIASLEGLRNENISSTTEVWELLSLAHKVGYIHGHLKKQILICFECIEVQMQEEPYKLLVHLIKTAPHVDNMKIIKILILGNNKKEEPLPLVDGSSKTRVSLEVLRRKHVLLLISDLDISQEEILLLEKFYKDSRTRHENQYEVVWIPVVDRLNWNEMHQQKFEHVLSTLPWYSVHHPLMIAPEIIKYIKEEWNFLKRLTLVALDPQGTVSSHNARNMLWIWGNLAFPFTGAKEEALWKEETWSLELLIDGIDSTILDWIQEGRFICIYGGEDIEWIRKFTSMAKAGANEAGIPFGMFYVGKSNAKKRMQKTIATFGVEKFSPYFDNLISMWFFWTRIETMLYSKLQYGKSVENDYIMNEVMTILSFDGSDQSWAIYFRGPDEMFRCRGDKVVDTLAKFKNWLVNVGIYPKTLQSEIHCNRLILPKSPGSIAELVVCADCGRPMENPGSTGSNPEIHCNRLILPESQGSIAELVDCADCGRPMENPGSSGSNPEWVVCAECEPRTENYFRYRCCVE
ncbi:protein SIEVE ELEMENT OCCLUSION B-like [Quillaja saponaria]|uniref:Protein SIEVE ELEMENT OCCLUSION B-like n=1 Tax=Quillaja saponaria TaxID=32244 RepID=A0AAD7LDI5_QUISA|nr:protein SIEVE ELEMENT OCCLUSION B-like [Quillaja saponaria]